MRRGGDASERDTVLAEPASPGWPDPMPPKLEWLMHQLEQVKFSRAEVIALWAKAVRKIRDATTPGLSTDTSLETAYAAGRIGALAVLASRHIRVRARQGHHELTFASVAALDLPGLEDIQVGSAEVRLDRRGADYSPDQATAEQAANAIAWARRTLPVLREALASGDPALGPLLDHPPDGS